MKKFTPLKASKSDFNKENRPSFSNVVNKVKTAVVQPKVSEEASKIYQVLYTADLKRKRKRYKDAYLLLTAKTVKLYDTEGKLIQRQNRSVAKKAYENLSIGSVLFCYSRSIEIIRESSMDDYYSGQLWLSEPPVATSPDQIQRISTKSSHKAFKQVSHGSANNKKLVKERKLDENAVLLLKSPTLVVAIDGFLGKCLRPHQKEGVKFLFDCVTNKGKCGGTRNGCILADEMGLGKTLQSITLLWTMLSQPMSSSDSCRISRPWCRKAIIVTPTSLVKNWSLEINKWLGRHRLSPVVVLKAGKTVAYKVNLFKSSKVEKVLIISYELYRKYHKILNTIEEVDLLICDEGHRLKAAKGNQTIHALNGIQTDRRIILTGTPIQNNLSEFYSLVNFVCPSLFGMDSNTFKRIFQTPIEKGTDKFATSEERAIGEARSNRLLKLTSSIILRRLADVNKKFLPPRTDITLFLRLTSEQELAYKAAIFYAYGIGCPPNSTTSALIKVLNDKIVSFGGSSASALQMISILRKLCLLPKVLLPSYDDSSTLQDTLSSKLLLMVKILENLNSSVGCEKVIIVSNSTKVLDFINEVLSELPYLCLQLDGKTPQNHRQVMVDKFNTVSNESLVVFLLSCKAGGCGLNLIGANRLFLLDPDWNPAVDQQALARIWRDGQKKSVFIYRFIAAGTIESQVYERQKQKLSTAGNLLNTGAQSLTKFSKEELRDLFKYKAPKSCSSNLFDSNLVEDEAVATVLASPEFSEAIVKSEVVKT